MPQLPCHLFRVPQDCVGGVGGHLGWQLVFEAEHPCEVVSVKNEEGEADEQKDYVGMLMSWYPLKAVKSNAEGQDIEHVDKHRCH